MHFGESWNNKINLKYWLDISLFHRKDVYAWYCKPGQKPVTEKSIGLRGKKLLLFFFFWWEGGRVLNTYVYTHKTEAQKWLRLSYGWVVYISLPSPQLRTLKEEMEESNEMMISGDDMDVTHSSYDFQHKTYAWPSMDRRGAPKVPSGRPIGNWWLLRHGESPFLSTRVLRGCQSLSDDPIIIHTGITNWTQGVTNNDF